MTPTPPRTRPRRYQLNKIGVRAVEAGHPWVFRKQLSSAAAVFADGQWLRLVDGENRVVGHGFFEAAGAIGIRVLAVDEQQPDAAWLADRLDAALARRAALRRRTDAWRAIHGENDGLPAVVFDVYGSVGVLQTYAAGADALGRLAAFHVRRRLGLSAVLWKPATRRRAGRAGPEAVRAPRALFGRAPEVIWVSEQGQRFAVDLSAGQKSGAFLDLRQLRRWVRGRELAGARVLNLFSYTGALGLAATEAGAAEIWNVDASEAALAFGARHHAGEGERQRWITADAFDWLPRLSSEERFDLVILDPPQMTSRAAQVPRALEAYRRLAGAAARHVTASGHLAVCCCTSRIDRRRLRAAVEAGLGEDFRFVERLPAEPDHPITFAEGDYLTVLIYRRA